MSKVCIGSILCLFLLGSAQAESPVYFADPHLQAAVEEQLWISDPTPTDMLGLVSLEHPNTYGPEHAIADLTGLVYATNLQTLNLARHRISSVSALAGLTNLRSVVLWGNQISDISSLSGLSTLEKLDIEQNEISDISALSALSNLQWLGLHRNFISDISSLSGLTALYWLDLRVNPLNSSAYDVYLPQIEANNPGITLLYEPPFEGLVTISSTVGGSVIKPGEGEFTGQINETWWLEAQADPGFVFVNWSGTYSSTANPTLLQIDQNYQIQANFASLLDILYVDDDAPGDPGPGDSARSDPSENGAPEHPFDSVCEALGVAREGASILVRPGTYRENIDFLRKNIRVIGRDPNDPTRSSWPVLEGTGNGPVVRFSGGQRSQCLLTGFVITAGQGRPAGAIYCEDASPTITHCLIVGNHSTDPDGAAVYCEDSRAVLTNCTIADNYAGQNGAGLTLIDSDVTVLDSILWDNRPYEIRADGTSVPDIRYCAVRGWWPDWGNIHANPRFARAGSWVNPDDPNEILGPADAWAVWVAGDYHLQSQAGRWDPQTQSWVLDEVTSPAIDAGLASSPVGHEPAPNGGRINMGVYGGTPEASKSPTLTAFP